MDDAPQPHHGDEWSAQALARLDAFVTRMQRTQETLQYAHEHLAWTRFELEQTQGQNGADAPPYAAGREDDYG
jgi:hypothetical protein